MGGNRIENEVCVGCGDPLIFPFNQFRMCHACLEKTKKAIYQTSMRQGSGRKNGTPIAATGISMPRGKLGDPVTL